MTNVTLPLNFRRDKRPLGPSAVVIMFLNSLLFSGCGSSSSTSPSSGGTHPASQITIQPMTTVNVSAGTGYFQDPYPIHTVTSGPMPRLPMFSGTTKQLISCTAPLQPACFTSTQIKVDFGSFATQAQDAGASISSNGNLNISEESTATWQMVVTANLTDTSSRWHAILHAYPTSSRSGIPTAWMADALFVSSLSAPGIDNYDGK